MTSPETLSVEKSSPVESLTGESRLGALMDRLAQLQGQRNVIDGEILDIVAELDAGDLLGGTGVRSTGHFVTWRLGMTPANARALCAAARRAESFPKCVAGLREGSLSLDQVATVTAQAPEGSDEHFASLASEATVPQLRTALRAGVPPKDPLPAAERFVRRHGDDDGGEHVRVKLRRDEGETFDTALRSHYDALVAEWKRDHGERDEADDAAPPFPTLADAFMRLVEAGWDADVAARPHGQRTTVVVHVDVEERVGRFHLGPALTDADRRYLACDATFEVWFERDGETIGCGRESRSISRRLRRALEYRHPTCVVPGCGVTRGLHAHHLWHWEDGGPTDLDNLVLVCPFHHRLHHRGLITICGPPEAVEVVDGAEQPLSGSSVARPPTIGPPEAAPYRGPSGERVDWKYYDPWEPRPGQPPEHSRCN